MKRSFQLLALALTFGTPATFAAEPIEPEEAPPALEEIVTQLELTEEQKAQIKPILEKQAGELKALRENPALKRRHKLRRAREINESASKRIRALLSSDQQEKYDALRAEAKAKLRERLKQRRGEP